MSRLKTLIKQFNWKILFIRILVNGIVVTVTVAILPDIYFAKPTIGSVLIIAVALGILNAIVKPLVLVLTGQFIIATFGLLLILVNTLILYLLERLFPKILVINSFWWALLASAIIMLLSNALENLLGLTPPIIPEKEAELRRRIEAGQQVSLASLVSKPQPVVQHDVDTQTVSEVAAARAVLDTLLGSPPTKDNNPQEGGTMPVLSEPDEEAKEDVPPDNAGETHDRDKNEEDLSTPGGAA